MSDHGRHTPTYPASAKEGKSALENEADKVEDLKSKPSAPKRSETLRKPAK